MDIKELLFLMSDEGMEIMFLKFPNIKIRTL